MKEGEESRNAEKVFGEERRKKKEEGRVKKKEKH